MKPRDSAALAAILILGALALVWLSTSSGGGMMGGMGGMMGGGMALAGLLVFVAIAFLVVALVSRPAAGMPPPIVVPPPTPVAPASPPDAAVPPPSAVEAAVVKLLDEDERLLYTRLRDAGAPVLQKDVVAWGTFSAAKVTRLLDRLETKGLVVRERHGMTNRIRLAYR